MWSDPLPNQLLAGFPLAASTNLEENEGLTLHTPFAWSPHGLLRLAPPCQLSDGARSGKRGARRPSADPPSGVARLTLCQSQGKVRFVLGMAKQKDKHVRWVEVQEPSNISPRRFRLQYLRRFTDIEKRAGHRKRCCIKQNSCPPHRPKAALRGCCRPCDDHGTHPHTANKARPNTSQTFLQEIGRRSFPHSPRTKTKQAKQGSINRPCPKLRQNKWG